MKFINEPLSSASYTEVGQTNPLRYYFVYVHDNDNYEYTSGIFKCKDYFNEVVSALRGVKATVYGMNYADTKRNEGFQAVKLVNILDNAVFTQNLDKINEWLVADGLEEFSYETCGKTEAMLTVPHSLFQNTYITSLLWYLIRISNVSVVIDKFANHPTKGVDNPFGGYYNKIMNDGFKLPIEGFWYYTEPKCEQDGTKFGPSDRASGPAFSVHNNGCYGWHSAYEVYN